MRLLLNWSERCGSQKLIDGQCAEGFELRIAGAATTSQARIVEVRFAPDSLLEEEGLEPSVPRRMDDAFEDVFLPLRHFPFRQRPRPREGDRGFSSLVRAPRRPVGTEDVGGEPPSMAVIYG
jgi:hypothetical protein